VISGLLGVLIGLCLWFTVAALLIVSLSATYTTYVALVVLALYRTLPPFGWLFLRRSRRMEKELKVLLEILRLDGYPLDQPELYVTWRYLRFCFHACVFPSIVSPAILVRHYGVEWTDTQLRWVLGHELGHIADHHLKRRGHPVLRLFRMNASSELVADTFAWYLLERMATFDATRPKHFDLVGFVLGKLPNLLASQPDIPSRR
jgi:hypothetical protein